MKNILHSHHSYVIFHTRKHSGEPENPGCPIPLLYKQRKTGRILLKIMLCSLLFYGYGNTALANISDHYDAGDELQNVHIEDTGMDEYGYYIQFYVPVSNTEGVNRWIKDGAVKFYYEGNYITIFNFNSKSAEDKKVNFSVTSSYYARIRAYNGTATENTWSEMITSSSGNQVVTDGGSDMAEIKVRWYVPNSFLDNSFYFLFEVTSDIDGNSGAGRGPTGDKYYYFAHSQIANPISDPTLTTSVASKDPGKMAVKYSFQTTIGANGESSFYTITHWIDDDTKNEITDQTNVNPSGSLEVSMSNSAKSCTFHTKLVCKGKYLTYSGKKKITVPAYVWPSSFTADYDGKDTVTVKWHDNTSNLGTGFVDNDNFEVQRSTDKTFGTNVTTVTNYAYKSSQADYQVIDNLNNIKGGDTVYYRIRRTKTQSDWNWKEEKATHVVVHMNSTQKTDTVVMGIVNGSPEDTITWEPFRGVWTQGTTFKIIKTNKTTSAQAATFNLTEAQARSGVYVDKNITYCNQFTYSISVTLGNGYRSPSKQDVPGSILAVKIGTIRDLTASKGYFPDRTTLRWQSEGSFEHYIVRRKVYGTPDSNYIQIATVDGAGISNIQEDDAKGSPGVYYQYSVVGTVTCNNEIRYSKDTLHSIGFRAPTGNIYGRITYGNGQAVKGAAVRLHNDDNTQMGQSIYLKGKDSSYLVLDSLHTPFTDSAFTLEAWIRPDDSAPKNEVIFSRDGQYELGFDNNGKLYFTYNGKRVAGAYVDSNRAYVHVAGIHSHDSLMLMLGDSVIARKTDPFSASHPGEKVYIGRNSTGDYYKGCIDEVSAWNVALTPQYVAKNYTRLLTGGEKGLAAYWRFDETIKDQFYDLSYENDTYHQNDGMMNPRFVTRSDTIPGPGQLSLEAYTDSTGNYMVSGIPYSGNGTTYSIVPWFGTHEFDPNAVNRLISDNSSSFTVDFTDKSSFPVTGHVFYNNTTVPVPGVMFKIDGQYAQDGDGNLLQTGSDGAFNISVPVGVHNVQAVKDNHIFVNAGRITDRHRKDLNYQAPYGPVTLYDSTTVRFIGRVAGGAVQEAYPLGFSLSKNNLGKRLSVVLTLPSQGKYQLVNGADSTVYVNHLLDNDSLPSYVTDTGSTRVVYSRNEIVIHPDSLTGEFEADLIPVLFQATDVEATGWGNILDNGKAVQVDLTNKFAVQKSGYDYEDSISVTTPAGMSWVHQQYSDTVDYNASYKFIKRIKTPTVTIVQVDNSGQALSYFGDSVYTYQSLMGSEEKIALIDHKGKGQAMYTLGYPVFTKDKPYQFRIAAYEQYPFYKGVDSKTNQPVQKEKDGKPVVDKVPTADGLVSIQNTLRNGAVQTDTLSLDSTGTGYYSFVGGDPGFVTQGLKSFAATIQFGAATQVNWNWLGKPQLKGYVLGGMLTGTDFVTSGPNEMLMILRDPPGNNSYSYAAKGTSFTDTKTYSGSYQNVGDEKFTKQTGVDIKTWQGVGGGLITETKAENGITLGIHHEENFTYDTTGVSTTTLTTRFQTSSDPSFVGTPADLYVGQATNITYGQSNNLAIIRKSDRRATDKVLSDTTQPYLVVERKGVIFGQSFNTLFAYTQQMIIKKLIPHLIALRDNLLLPPSTSPAAAQALADRSKREIYVSKLAASDPNFGKTNGDANAFGKNATLSSYHDGPSYKIYFPEKTSSLGKIFDPDSVLLLNQYVQGWKNEIADNEKEKLNASYPKNFSFQAGSPVDYSKSTNHSLTKTYNFNIIVAGNVANSVQIGTLGNGVEFKFKETLGTRQGGTIVNGTAHGSTIGFNLSSKASSGEYLSVDVGMASDSDFVFRLKGGETQCPYEGADSTLFYQKGAPLGQSTAQMDKPVISVDQPVVNDVPSTKAASYTIHLSNASETQSPEVYVLSYANTDSIKGAWIGVDGVSISGGKSFVVPYGETVTKVLTLQKGPKAMDYNNIPIILHSSCQYDPTGYQALIADTVLISAHFVPSCSNINVKSPSDQWILNTLSQTNQQGKRYIPVTLDQFDESDSLFDHIELQYKPSANSQWVSVMNFYADSAKYRAAQGDKAMITNAQAINYDLVMDDATYNDQTYDIRALAVCQLGPGNFINTPSNVVSGLKDTYNPRLFGSPEPANGVLGPKDNIRLNFNEPIASGLLTSSDFQVTGIRNGAKDDHSVSVQLDGQGDYIQSEFDKNLAGRDITAEMWILPDGKESGTVFSQGDINHSMELAITSDNHLQVTIGQETITSPRPFDYQPGQWAHVALVYHAADSMVSAFYNFQEVISRVKVRRYTGTGPFVFGKSIRQKGNYFAGKMHGASIWTKDMTGTQLQLNSLTRFSGAEDGLLAYYPMTEGKGTTIFDRAHGDNATLTGTWSTPPGRSIELNGNGYTRVSTAAAPITSEMDYTIGIWFKAKPGQSNAALASSGKGDGTDPGTTGSKKLFYLGFENGLLTFENNGVKIQATGNYLDNHWHHVAVAVNRTSETARLYVDGVLKKYIDAQGLGGIAAAYTYLGARAYLTDTNAIKPVLDRYFTGDIDEFRIWNTYLDQNLISKNSNTHLKGDELGLLVYYPFEKYYEFQGQKEMDTTSMDQKIPEQPNEKIPYARVVNAKFSNDMAPIKYRGPVNNLNFNFVVNNDALIINMLEPKQAIDKTIVTFQVKNVQDLHGNSLLSPITWTAYIDQNPLSWSDDELNLSKDIDKPMQFTAYVVNSGGSNENFTLDNLPAWLTADVTNGTVPPEGKQEITFTINEGINVGNYNEIVYMRNDNGESQALSLNLKVIGNTPDWKVNPADFRYNMTIYGKIRVDGIFSGNPDDMLAAFHNGKCVGVVHNTYYQQGDLWYAFLTVYSDSLQTKGLEFRIWDTSNGKVYVGVPGTGAIAFKNGAIIGTPRSPVIFDGKELIFQNIQLNKGWNWLSFNIAGQDFSSVNATLANGNWQSGDIIKLNSQGFATYSAVDSEWVTGALKSFNNQSSYMLKTTNAQTLSVGGTAVDISGTAIPLRGGNQWNYVSYLPQGNMTVADALAGYQASNGDVIKSQTGFAMYDSKLGWVGNLTYMEPGKGYMLYRTAAADTAFHYPVLTGNLHRESTGLAGNDETIGRLNPYQAPVPGNYSYANNMTMIAVTGNEFHLLPGDRLLAYANGELRGEAQAITDPLTHKPVFFMNISGKDDQPLYFEIERDRQVKAQSEPLFSFAVNSEVGTLGKPYAIHFDKVIKHISIAPNPFSSEVDIRIGLGLSQNTTVHTIQISVYDMLGRVIYTGDQEKVKGGYYQTRWNGRMNSGLPVGPGVYFIRIMTDGKAHTYKVVKY